MPLNQGAGAALVALDSDTHTVGLGLLRIAIQRVATGAQRHRVVTQAAYLPKDDARPPAQEDRNYRRDRCLADRSYRPGRDGGDGKKNVEV
ncbi:MAG: hypothetical protein ACK4IT_02865 [Thioalkalivibrionaceae bacterium]